MRRNGFRFAMLVQAAIAIHCLPILCRAQDGHPARFEVRAIGGWAAFPDENWGHHALGGASFRVGIVAGLFVGSETLYMIGPGDDRDVTLMPLVGYEFRRFFKVQPYVNGAWGRLWHRQRTGTGAFWGEGATFGAGLGFRIAVSDHFIVAPEFRLGWEPFTRTTLGVGYRF